MTTTLTHRKSEMVNEALQGNARMIQVHLENYKFCLENNQEIQAETEFELAYTSCQELLNKLRLARQ